MTGKNVKRQFLYFLLIFLLFPQSLFSSGATLYETSLRKVNEMMSGINPRDFSFAVIGDSRDNEEIFRKLLSAIEKARPLFILHGGDIVAKGCESELIRFLSFYDRTTNLPLFVIPGNHEHCPKEKDSLGPFKQLIGPSNFTLNFPYLGLTIIGLDNSRGYLTQEQWKVLNEATKIRKPHTFVAMHIPPRTPRWGERHTMKKGSRELITLLAGVTAAFFSHLHLYDVDAIGDLRLYITGGGGAPLHPFLGFGRADYHFLLVRIKNGEVIIEPRFMNSEALRP